MTQLEVAIKYDVPQCDVCNACRNAGVRPVDRNWDLPAVGKALYDYYEARARRYRQKAIENTEKAVRILDGPYWKG